MSSAFTVIIPARLASTRLPGKPLLDIGGKPLIRHAWEAARASGAARVLIATDDPRIEHAALGFGAEAMITDAGHASGTDRLAEVVRRLELPVDAVVINVQGDEFGLPPALIRQLAALLAADEDEMMATLCEPITREEDYLDPNVVKVVCSARGHALYFSRAPLPWAAAGTPGSALRHIGLYAYRAGFLLQYSALAPCELERSERLEQLRALYHGYRIRIAVAEEAAGLGVDTSQDLERARRIAAGGAP